MTWTYAQGTGHIFYCIGGDTPDIVVRGYSGFGEGKNNPYLENVPDVGPIPRGTYSIGPAYDDPEKGPVVMALHPDISNKMYGRSGFLIHGDSVEHPGEASHGCIILDRATREAIAASSDRRLVVL